VLSCLAGLAEGKTDNPLDRYVPVPATEPIPIVDFFRPSVFRSPQLNDAGTKFAAMITVGADREELMVYDFAKAAGDRLRGIGKQDIYDFDWLDDEHILFPLSSEKRYREGLYVADVGDLGSACFLDLHNVSLVVARPESERMKPVVWIKHSAYNNGRDGGVLQINAKVHPKNPFTTSAYIDPRSLSHGTTASVIRSYPAPELGIPIWYSPDLRGNLAYAYVSDNGAESLFRLVDNKWVKCPVDLDTIDILGSDLEGKLIVLGPRQEGKPRALQYMDAATGKLGEVIWQDAKYDPSNCAVYRHPVSKALLGIRFDRGMRETLWLDKSYQTIQDAVEKFLPGQVVQILGSDKAEKRFFVAAQSDRQPTIYYTVDLGKRTLGLIKNQAPWIDPARMMSTSLIAYKSREGVLLEGYLTMPAGASKANPAPMVVLPHGGPWVRDTWGYDDEVQFLASRGYAVFQPNYRGSLGTQWRFPETDMYEFRKMHNDVTDGVKKMIASGLIDADRVAIMGWSFGGYLALSGAAYDGQLYRCAVALSGVYDWEQVMREAKNEEYLRGRYGFLRRHLGDPKTNKAKFDEISPLRHVDQVKIPMFVGHGKSDVIADPEQSRHLIAELKKIGVPVVSRFESGEGHGMAQLKNRIEMYEEIEKFLAANMVKRAKPDAAKAPAAADSLPPVAAVRP
jgi:acetyl esterase/lipase